MTYGISEGLRRTLASLAQWGGWLGSLGFYSWSALLNEGTEPHWAGFTFILLIGIAIGGTTARARMRLTDSIVGAFRAGMESVKQEVEEIVKPNGD